MNSILSVLTALIGGHIVRQSGGVKSAIANRLATITRDTPLTGDPFVYHPWVALVGGILTFVGIVGVIILVLTQYPKLQSAVLPAQGIRFLNGGQYALTMIWMVLGPLLVALLIVFIAWALPWVRDQFFLQSVVSDLKFTGETLTAAQAYAQYDVGAYGRSQVLRLAILFGALCLLTLPLQWMALKSYTEVKEEGVALVKVLGWTETFYAWDQVDRYTLQIEKGNDRIDPQLLIEFKDGTSVDIWEIGASGTATEDLLAAVEVFNKNDIPLNKELLPDISPLRDEVEAEIEQVWEEVTDFDIFDYVPEGSMLEELLRRSEQEEAGTED